MGRRNLPCSTVKAQTEKSMGARLASSSSASSSDGPASVDECTSKPSPRDSFHSRNCAKAASTKHVSAASTPGDKDVPSPCWRAARLVQQYPGVWPTPRPEPQSDRQRPTGEHSI